MSKRYLIAILLLLSLVAPFAATADRFYVNPEDLERGKIETLQFVLENSQEFFGFQANVSLPAGLEVVKGTDGELEVTLSNRADDGNFRVNSNLLPDGSLIMGAFSSSHKAFSGENGVLVNLNVMVSQSFAGGTVEVFNTKFINSQDKDVEFDSTSASLGVVGPAYEMGDVNGDGKVTAGDVVSLVNTIIGNKPSFFIDEVADANGDGKITAGDVVSVVNIIINK